MPYISKIKLASSENVYVIKDAWARQAIEALGSPTHFLGVTTTALSDGAETNPIVINGEEIQASSGDIVVYSDSEFIWGASQWYQFGDLSSLGDLAYHDIEDIEVSLSLSKDEVLGSATTFTSAQSQVTFAEGAGSDFVTGYNNDAVAPSFIEGQFTPASLAEGFVSAGSAAQFTEGAFTPAAIQEGFVTAGRAASYSHSGFSGGSLGEATTGNFATNGIVAAMGTGEDAETLIFSTASTSAAVTAQGSFAPAVYGTDTFDGGAPTAIDTTKFSGGSKAQDTFVTNTPTAIDVTKFSGGSKIADTFNAGSAATLAKAKAITASDTGTAAAQTIAVGSNDLVNTVVNASGSVAYSAPQVPGNQE